MLATDLIAALKVFLRHLEFAIYIRLLRPDDLITIHAELVAAFMAFHPPHAQRPRLKEIEAFMRAFVTSVIAILLVACAGPAGTPRSQPTARTLPQPTIAEIRLPTSTGASMPSPTKTLTPTMTYTPTAISRTPSPGTTKPPATWTPVNTSAPTKSASRTPLPSSTRPPSTWTPIPAQPSTWTPVPIILPSPTWTPVIVDTPTARPTTRICCKVCSAGKACGDTCISKDKTCTKPPGCACDG